MQNDYSMKQILFLITAALWLTACTNNDAPEQEEGKLNIVTTTGMIKDAVANIAGDKAEVVGLMGPGVDPHLYKATQGDLGKLNEADMIFYNGLHLEGKMGEVLEKVAARKPVIAVAEGISEDELIKADYAGVGAHDPHIWFDVALWSKAVEYAGNALIEAYPQHEAYFRENMNSHLEELQALDEWVSSNISQIPERQRVLITAHDAFEYFGRAYDMEVRGLQGISTVSEYGLQDITNMTDFIAERNIKAVFVESSVPEKALKAVVEGCAEKGHDVRIGGTLYSDAMGAEGTPEGTYIGMVRANVNTIVSSLK